MKRVALRDVVDVVGGGTPRKSVPSFYGGGIPWVTPKDMKRFLIGESEITLTDDGVRNSPAKMVPEGSVLVVVRSGVLKHTLPVALTTRPVTVNQDMKALTPRGDLDPLYLARLLKTLQPKVLTWVRATTADNFPIDNLLGLEIDLPPLPEQRRIAAILDHADALRAKRRQVLAHLDSLPQSIFRDMFADDPGSIRELGEVARMYAGSSLPAGQPYEGQENGVLLMRVSDMNSPGNETEILRTASWSVDRGANSSTVASGAVVLPKRGASIATNKKRLTTRRTLLDPNLMGLEPREGLISSRYLFEWFRAFDLARITSGSTVPQLNKQDLEPLQIPVPSMERQLEFERRVSMVAPVQVGARQASACEDELYEALQSRAFRGEL